MFPTTVILGMFKMRSYILTLKERVVVEKHLSGQILSRREQILVSQVKHRSSKVYTELVRQLKLLDRLLHEL